jgi:hypothetical protein
MASEKQIAANRRNARNSTGPKTIAGKKRASLNALRHGLSSQGLRTFEAERVEQLARQIAGDCENRIVLELARSAAAAELELAQVRQVQADLIALALSLGSLEPLDFRSAADKVWTAGMQLVKLAKLERYERRAFSRRNRALRAMYWEARAAPG